MIVELFGVVGAVVGLGIRRASSLLLDCCFIDGDRCELFVFGFLQDVGSGGGGGGMFISVTA